MINAYFIFAIIVLSQAATLIRYAEAHAIAICFWRLAIAAAFLLPLHLYARSKSNIGHRGTGFDTTNPSSYRNLTKSEIVHLIASGAALFIHFFFFFRSVQETTVANASILFSLNPVFTAIGAWLFFQQRPNIYLYVSLTLGIAGIATLFAETLQLNPNNWHGDLYGILSALCFSAYILTGKHLRQRLSNTAYTLSIYTQTAIYAGLTAVALQIPLAGYNDTTWLALMALAIFPTLLGHALFTYCLNYMDVNFMSCMTLVEPLLAAVVAYYLFAEPFTPWAGVAFLLTVASVLALYWPSLKRFVQRA